MQTYDPKVFIYLAETVFIAGNVEGILGLLFSPSHGASCVSQSSYCLSIHVHTWDTVHAVYRYIASQQVLQHLIQTLLFRINVFIDKIVSF